jgi:hypothetical protein
MIQTKEEEEEAQLLIIIHMQFVFNVQIIMGP